MNETVDLGKVADARPASLPVHSPSPVTAPAAPPPAPRRNRLTRLVVVLAFALALIAGGLYYEKIGTSTLDASRPAEPKGPPPQTVRAAEAVSGDMPITIDALGTVTPLATVTIKTQIAGKLMQVGFTEGQLVKEGDFLAQIDPRPFEAVLAQAQGQLAKDTSLYGQAQADLARYITLSKQDSIAHQQVDDQTFLVAQDKAAIFHDSVAPIVEAGKADLVASDAAISEEITLIPTPGHSPGHVSLHIRSAGEEGLLTGDVAHHPCQMAHLDWSSTADSDPSKSAATRRELFSRFADRPVLVIGGHFDAGHIKREGDAFKFIAAGR